MKVYSVADHIISPLGFSTSQNFSALKNSQSGIRKISSGHLLPESFYGAAIAQEEVDQHFKVEDHKKFSFLEKLIILSIQSVLETIPGLDKSRLLLVISTTKGNIDHLGRGKGQDPIAERVEMAKMARAVNSHFSLPHEPLVVSNACISGVSALIVGQKLIRMRLYDHVMVTGGDILSEFVLSGFQCLKAISDEPCRPYDATRKGISLGEACGTVLLSNDPALCSEKNSLAVIRGGGQSNDANHISGPSRTGKGLKIAVNNALRNSKISAQEVNYINAHGTATLFNDEMEAVAFHDLGLQEVPVNSLKGYFGHTLGAAGVVETIMATWQLNNTFLFKSRGYEQSGLSKEINVLKENVEARELHLVMKTVSGFGGCNAAIILEKV